MEDLGIYTLEKADEYIKKYEPLIKGKSFEYFCETVTVERVEKVAVNGGYELRVLTGTPFYPHLEEFLNKQQMLVS